MKHILITFSLVFACGIHAIGKPQSLPGKETKWHGFPRYDFKLGNVSCRVVSPKFIANGKPWIWTWRIFGQKEMCCRHQVLLFDMKPDEELAESVGLDKPDESIS